MCAGEGVPARVGGVDLSMVSPSFSRCFLVPARVGGVDLSQFFGSTISLSSVPARVGGVDLSSSCFSSGATI